MNSILIIGDGTIPSTELYRSWELLHPSTCVLGPAVSARLSLPAETLREFSALILVPANTFPGLSDEFQGRLRDYVLDGGLLACLPFTAWAARANSSRVLEDLLPVRCDGFDENLRILIDESACSVPGEASEYARLSSFPDLAAAANATPIMASAEYLQPTSSGVVLAEFVAGGQRLPLAVHRRVGDGAVLYLNLCHHPNRDAGSIWDTGQQREGSAIARLAYTLVDYTARALRARRKTPLAGFDQQQAEHLRRASYWGLAKHLESGERPDASALRTSHGWYSVVGHLDAMWAHYGAGSDPASVFFPSIDEYLGMPRVAKLTLCRNLLFLSEGLFDGGHSTGAAESLSTHQYESDTILNLLRPTPHNKKRLLEALACYCFLLVDGIDVVGRNVQTATGELDLVFSADSSAVAELWPEFPATFAVECKNWSEPVGAHAIRDFRGKLDDIGLKLGFVVCRLGTTGGRHRDASALLRDYRRDGVFVIVITANDLRSALRRLSPAETLRNAYRKVSLL